MKSGVVIMVAFVAAGCSVGPKYQRPAIEAPTAYKEPPPDSWKESQGWKTAQPADTAKLRRDWWTLFGDAELNALEQQVDVSNQNLKAAQARFDQARALIRVSQSQKYPTVTAGAEITSANRDSSTYALATSKTAHQLRQLQPAHRCLL